jgi:pimeloyl-ACP methyl ester carboxylesterase
VIPLVLASAALAGVWLLWRYPLASAALVGRAGLRLLGFRKVVLEAPPGRLVYFTAGSGPPVIFVHGVNDQAGTWVGVAPALARQYRVVVVDLPGHGDSEPRVGSLTPGHLLEGLSAVVGAEARGRQVTLAGNSLGGAVAFRYALAHPTGVAHVVLVNGVIGRRAPAEAAALLLPRTREQARKAMATLSSPRSPRVPAFVLDDLVRRAPGTPLARLLAQPEDALTP